MDAMKTAQLIPQNAVDKIPSLYHPQAYVFKRMIEASRSAERGGQKLEKRPY